MLQNWKKIVVEVYSVARFISNVDRESTNFSLQSFAITFIVWIFCEKLIWPIQEDILMPELASD